MALVGLLIQTSVGRAGGEDAGAVGLTDGGETVVHVMRGEEAEADVVLLAVVPGEEVAAEAARVFESPEALGEVRAVLERLELGLGERVVDRSRAGVPVLPAGRQGHPVGRAVRPAGGQNHSSGRRIHPGGRRLILPAAPSPSFR